MSPWARTEAGGGSPFPCLILLAAAALRLWSLPSPPSLYWDEQYYVFDAEVYLHGGFGQPVGNPPPVKIDDEGTWIHPPMGKWIIALLGVGPLGLHAFGWRLPSALFGIAGVALLYLLALRLWGSPGWAAFAAVLLAFDGLHIVQSRLAMLDIFLSTFIIAGFLFLVLDRERLRSGRRDAVAPDHADLRLTVAPVGGGRLRGGDRDEMVGLLRAGAGRAAVRRVEPPARRTPGSDRARERSGRSCCRWRSCRCSSTS